jgi:hypothetical protein
MKKILLLYFLSFSLLFAADDYDIYDDGTANIKDESDYSNYHKPQSSPKSSQKTSKVTNKTKNPFSKNKDNKDNKYPNTQTQILFEYHFNFLDDSKKKVRSDDDITDTYLNTIIETGLNLNENFFILTEWQFRPVGSFLKNNDLYAKSYIVDREGSDDLFGEEDYIRRRKFHYNDYGLAINTLNINFKNTNMAFGLGKIEASFASGYDKNRFMGINGTLLTEEYRLNGVLGFYVAALLPFGKIQFNLFRNDDTDLTNTMFTKRGKKDLDYSSGYDKFNNFSISFDGKFNNNIIVNGGLKYLYVDDNKNYGSFDNEIGLNLGIEKLHEYSNGVTIVPFAEIVYIGNYKGYSDFNVIYTTETFSLFFENWRFLISSTLKFEMWNQFNAIATNEHKDVNTISWLNQFSVGYKFDNGLMIDFSEAWRKTAHVINCTDSNKYSKIENYTAVMVSYLLEF